MMKPCDEPWPNSPDKNIIKPQIERFIAEDAGFGDLTGSCLFDRNVTGQYGVVTREPCVVSGLIFLEYFFPDCTIDLIGKDGEPAQAHVELARISGSIQTILSRERVALNLLQHLSAIASQTAQFVAIIVGSGCVLLDTRKTTPGLRLFEKYAVRCGGGRNHRMDLSSGVMIKDNHLAFYNDTIIEAVNKLRANSPILTKIEVECDTLEQVKAAIAAKVDMILLDNMDTLTLNKAVELVAKRIPLEASGGITAKTIAAVAKTGVDYISVGCLTKPGKAIDIGLDAR